jgi:hypothetical protein
MRSRRRAYPSATERLSRFEIDRGEKPHTLHFEQPLDQDLWAPRTDPTSSGCHPDAVCHEGTRALKALLRLSLLRHVDGNSQRGRGREFRIEGDEGGVDVTSDDDVQRVRDRDVVA